MVGVVPASFTFYGHDRDVYTPIGQWNDPSFRDRRISVSAHVVGRLKPGVTLPQANTSANLSTPPSSTIQYSFTGTQRDGTNR